MFSTKGRDDLEKTCREKWSEFRDDLIISQVDYKDLDTIMKNNFMSALDSMLNYENNICKLQVSSAELQHNYIFCRATKLSDSEPKENIPKDRFLPKSEFITDDNRFSPKGVEYLYLACRKVGFGGDTEYNIPKMIALREIRANKGDQIAICKFNLLDKVYNVIDLTIANERDLDEIVREYNTELRRLYFVLKKSKSYIKRRSLELINEMGVYIYMNLLSSELFKPLEDVEKGKEYLPFHCLAEYFKNVGLDGIIYSSTVYEGNEGKNLVLFDKKLGNPIEYYVEVQ